MLLSHPARNPSSLEHQVVVAVHSGRQVRRIEGRQGSVDRQVLILRYSRGRGAGRRIGTGKHPATSQAWSAAACRCAPADRTKRGSSRCAPSCAHLGPHVTVVHDIIGDVDVPVGDLRARQGLVCWVSRSSHSSGCGRSCQSSGGGSTPEAGP